MALTFKPLSQTIFNNIELDFFSIQGLNFFNIGSSGCNNGTSQTGDVETSQRNSGTQKLCISLQSKEVHAHSHNLETNGAWRLDKVQWQSGISQMESSSGTFATLNANVQWHHRTFREILFKMKAGTWKPQGALAPWTATMGVSRTKRAAIQRLSQYIQTHGQKICKRTFSYYCSFAYKCRSNERVQLRHVMSQRNL